MEKKIYYCNECKKVVHEMDKIFFVEKSRFRGFCSEKCILNFFTDLIKYLEKEEDKFRKNEKLKEKINLKKEDYEKLMESALTSPSEIWMQGEDLSEEIYFFLKESDNDDLPHMIVALLVFDDKPSFLFLETLTKHQKILDFYRRGRKIDDLSSKMDAFMTDPELFSGQGPTEQNDQQVSMGEDFVPMQGMFDEEKMSMLEAKRTQILTTLLNERSNDDISYENFPLYEVYAQETLDRPDEVYRLEETNKEITLTFIRGFQREEMSFFYIVICMLYSTGMMQMGGTSEDVLLPIISFPTKDGGLCKKYKIGEKIEGHSLS